MWRHVGESLAAQHTVICPDLRGYGAGDKPRAPWAPDLDHRLTRAGHFMAEELPDEIAAVIRDLLGR